MAISGAYAVVGAWGADCGQGSDCGAAYVFERSTGGSWNETAKLASIDLDEDNYFGYSVAISDADGRVVVGAYGADLVVQEDYENHPGEGAAYVFGLESDGNWTQMTKFINAGWKNYDYFGQAVAISDDGYIVVGAKQDDDDVDGYGNSGSATIFFYPECPAGEYDSGAGCEICPGPGGNQTGSRSTPRLDDLRPETTLPRCYAPRGRSASRGDGADFRSTRADYGWLPPHR